MSYGFNNASVLLHQSKIISQQVFFEDYSSMVIIKSNLVLRILTFALIRSRVVTKCYTVASRPKKFILTLKIVSIPLQCIDCECNIVSFIKFIGMFATYENYFVISLSICYDTSKIF